MTKTKLPLRILPQKESRELLNTMIECSPEDLAQCEEDTLMLFRRAHEVHDKTDREVNKIWRRIVKGSSDDKKVAP